ncbi:MAG: hypothetical protein HOC74_07855 [Gemmatimonadetes bacterium]|jgi:hypothetical protein|nr:hypothetical protein [Gemmatimonadota bacterium]
MRANLNREGITTRSFVAGVTASLVVGAGVAYADNVIRGSYLAIDFGSPVAVFLLFVLAALLNPLLGLLQRSWHLSASEVALVYIMALVAASVPSMGLTGFFLPYLSGAQYYATPENGWTSLFIHYVPDWMVPLEPGAIKDFYEGTPRGTGGVAWAAWLPALLAWVPFLVALYLVMIALMVILRKQWMDHERLSYPLMQPSLAMIETESGRRAPALFRTWLFWIGMAIPFTVGAINALHAYHSFIPRIELQTSLPIFRGMASLRPTLSFATLGLSYFLSRDVALGIWVFNLLAKVQEGAFGVLGIRSTETMEWVTVPILAHQSIGAMTMFVLFGLWMGRGHLRAVARKAFRGDDSIDDSGEMLSYRTAVFSVIGGTALMWWWLWKTGLPVWMAGVVLFMAFVIFVGLTRMVTEGGFFITRAPINPGNFAVSGFGVENIGAQGVTALGYTFVWAGEMRIFVMAAVANALKIAEGIRGNRRLLLWAILTALLISAVSSVWVELSLGYKYGGINLSPFYTGLVHYPFNFIARNLNNATPVNWNGWLWTAYGGALMAVLMVAKQRLVWWPIHPMSLPVSSMWMTDTIMLSVFMSWLIKGAILHYGGPAMYRRGKPLFIGLVVGQFGSMGFWVIVDYLTGMSDNLVFFL